MRVPEPARQAQPPEHVGDRRLGPCPEPPRALPADLPRHGVGAEARGVGGVPGAHPVGERRGRRRGGNSSSTSPPGLLSFSCCRLCHGLGDRLALPQSQHAAVKHVGPRGLHRGHGHEELELVPGPEDWRGARGRRRRRRHLELGELERRLRQHRRRRRRRQRRVALVPVFRVAGRGRLHDPARPGRGVDAPVGLEPLLVLAHQLEGPRDGLPGPARAGRDEREVLPRRKGFREGPDLLSLAEPVCPEALEASRMGGRRRRRVGWWWVGWGRWGGRVRVERRSREKRKTKKQKKQNEKKNSALSFFFLTIFEGIRMSQGVSGPSSTSSASPRAESSCFSFFVLERGERGGKRRF